MLRIGFVFVFVNSVCKCRGSVVMCHVQYKIDNETNVFPSLIELILTYENQN